MHIFGKHNLVDYEHWFENDQSSNKDLLHFKKPDQILQKTDCVPNSFLDKVNKCFIDKLRISCTKHTLISLKNLVPDLQKLTVRWLVNWTGGHGRMQVNNSRSSSAVFWANSDEWLKASCYCFLIAVWMGILVASIFTLWSKFVECVHLCPVSF